MTERKEFDFTLQYTGGQLNSGAKNLYPKMYGKGNFEEDGIQYATDVLEFSEALKTFEAECEQAFTKPMDLEVLAKIFIHMLNAYTDKNSHSASQYEFRDWCLYSFEEIQDALDGGSHAICCRCGSIVPKREMVVVSDNCLGERQVCKTCAREILNQ